MGFKFIPKSKTGDLPKESGVYCFRGGGEILYIGKASNIRERVKNHFLQPAYRDYLFLDKIEKVGFLKTDSEIEALILEANLIKKYQPKYNVVWRDDKNYFFVGIAKEDFPRIFWTHQVSNFEFRISKFEIVGPFVDGKALKQTLKVLRRVFPYRSCRVLPNRPCLWYHLKRCLAPCLLKKAKTPLLCSNRVFAKMKEESQRNAKNLMKILKEGRVLVLKDLKKEMKLASKNEDFEKAGKIRDQINALERVVSHAKIFSGAVDARHFPSEGWEFIQEKLKKILKIKKKISRIEAYDVSNIQGQEATGAMVTFINCQPNKNFYRKFKIKITGKPNDPAMLKEIISRRIKHPEWPFPDLILVDGGRAQLNALRNFLKQTKYRSINLVALAKKKNELFIEGRKKPLLLKKLPREVFNLILQLRDEAHRFARKYHLKLREIDFFPSS